MTFGNLTPEAIAFGFFTILILGGAIGVVTNRNLVRAAMWLMASLFGVAGYFVLLSAPFLAAVQILVYIGAIGILITFAVMLTRSMTHMPEPNNRQWWAAGAVAGPTGRRLAAKTPTSCRRRSPKPVKSSPPLPVELPSVSLSSNHPG